jgi:hypothetical protein
LETATWGSEIGLWSHWAKDAVGLQIPKKQFIERCMETNLLSWQDLKVSLIDFQKGKNYRVDWVKLTGPERETSSTGGNPVGSDHL